MNDNVTPMPTIEQDKFRAAIEGMKRQLALTLEYNELLAKIRKASYDAHIKQGFTPEQALQLCNKNQGV